MNPATYAALKAYVDHGQPPGGFLRSALCNDFVGACLLADQENRDGLVDLASRIWNDLPGDSWGSMEKVNAWIEQHAVRRERIARMNREASHASQ